MYFCKYNADGKKYNLRPFLFFPDKLYSYSKDKKTNELERMQTSTKITDFFLDLKFLVDAKYV